MQRRLVHPHDFMNTWLTRVQILPFGPHHKRNGQCGRLLAVIILAIWLRLPKSYLHPGVLPKALWQECQTRFLSRSAKGKELNSNVRDYTITLWGFILVNKAASNPIFVVLFVSQCTRELPKLLR